MVNEWCYCVKDLVLGLVTRSVSKLNSSIAVEKLYKVTSHFEWKKETCYAGSFIKWKHKLKILIWMVLCIKVSIIVKSKRVAFGQMESRVSFVPMQSFRLCFPFFFKLKNENKFLWYGWMCWQSYILFLYWTFIEREKGGFLLLLM